MWILTPGKGASQRTSARRQEALSDARLFEESERPRADGRGHFEERDEIDGIVDVHPDSRMADDERVDPTGSRGIEMRIEAVLAEPQRDGVRRRADDGVRSEIVMRWHDGEGGRGPVRRKRRFNLSWRQSRNVAGHGHHS